MIRIVHVTLYRSKSWTLMKQDGKSLWTLVLERFPRTPRTAKKTKQWIIEAQITRLKLSHLGHIMWRSNSLEKIIMLGKIEGNRRRHPEARWMNLFTVARPHHWRLERHWRQFKNRSSQKNLCSHQKVKNGLMTLNQSIPDMCIFSGLHGFLFHWY